MAESTNGGANMIRWMVRFRFYFLAAIFLMSLPAYPSLASSIRLACHIHKSENADERLKLVDDVEIDVEQRRIELRSTANSEASIFLYNRGYDKRLDFYDKIHVFKFSDGRILAAGIRAQSAFGFDFEPDLSSFVYTFSDRRRPGFLMFSCNRLK
jgi:hypothetical protein